MVLLLYSIQYMYKKSVKIFHTQLKGDKIVCGVKPPNSGYITYILDGLVGPALEVISTEHAYSPLTVRLPSQTTYFCSLSFTQEGELGIGFTESGERIVNFGLKPIGFTESGERRLNFGLKSIRNNFN